MATIQQVIAKYIQLRDELKARRADFDAYESTAKTNMVRLEQWLLTQSKESGIKSFSSDSGTAFRSKKDYVRLDPNGGWEKLTNYAKETGDFSVFEKRPGKNHIKELMFEGGHKATDLGITYESHTVMQVRAASNKGK